MSYTNYMKTNSENGYVGLFILLISIAAIGLIFAFTMLTPDMDNENPENIGRTEFEKAQETIEMGRDAGNIIKSHDEDLQERLDNM